MFVKDFLDEYGRYRAAGEKAMAQVSDEALNHIPVVEGNSIAMLARHVGGNLTSRFTDFLTADGEKPWRDRDAEFGEGPFTRAEAQSVWAKGFDVVAGEVGKLSDQDLERTVKIRGVELTVHEALCRSLAHMATHVGQIVLLSKIAAGASWQTLSIPKGQSAQYNANPRYEKAAQQADALRGSGGR
jgi:hypothetical protein